MNLFRPGMLIIMISIVSHSVSAQKSLVSASTTSELEQAESKMFAGILHRDADYFRDYVSNDYITINADGVMADKEQTYADTSRYKFLSDFTWKLFDKTIRAYGDVGIITGRTKVYMKDAYVLEFLYTAIFVKDHQKWMFTGWQGTISKDSPKPLSMPSK